MATMPTAAHPLGGMIRQMHHTAVSVRDFDAARDFFVDVLGFAVEGEARARDEPALGEVVGLPGAVVDWAMLARGEDRIELFRYHQPEGRMEPAEQCDVGYVHIAMQVDDVDAAYDAALAAGFRTRSSPRSLRGGRTRVFYMIGPEGLVVEFIEFRAETGESR
ncbi:VOC family protein [Marivibrio halodurans]|uniref:VOC family protein n=1 Tax=Marivibrio halodurans TaxID=2039722 RepID=A0A8J7RZE2_9PROT|nr:VOC family protein [Marivibrio halodurans]MBP5857125.1 VOC family protein [Marivibrio halodurans]